MQKFVSREKLGKRAKQALDREQRQTWAINPISRKSKNMKAYDRKKARYHSNDDGIGLFSLTQFLASISFFVLFYFENIDRVNIRATEYGCSFRLARYAAAISENINVWKGDMQRHRSKVATLRVEIKTVPDLMPPVALYRAFSFTLSAHLNDKMVFIEFQQSFISHFTQLHRQPAAFHGEVVRKFLP